MADTREDSAALVAAPASTSLIGVAPPRPIEPIPNTNTAVMPAPNSASHIYSLAVVMLNKAMPHTTNKEAPVLTPSMLGSANGLRVTDCISAPDTPSAAPQNKLNIVRETLFRTTLAPKESIFGLNKPSISSFQRMTRAPKSKDATAHTPSSTIPMVNTNVKCFGICEP